MTHHHVLAEEVFLVERRCADSDIEVVEAVWEEVVVLDEALECAELPRRGTLLPLLLRCGGGVLSVGVPVTVVVARVLGVIRNMVLAERVSPAVSRCSAYTAFTPPVAVPGTRKVASKRPPGLTLTVLLSGRPPKSTSTGEHGDGQKPAPFTAITVPGGPEVGTTVTLAAVACAGAGGAVSHAVTPIAAETAMTSARRSIVML